MIEQMQEPTAGSRPEVDDKFGAEIVNTCSFAVVKCPVKSESVVRIQEKSCLDLH